MKIAILSTQDVYGGAAKATYNLYKALKIENINVTYFVKHKSVQDNYIIDIPSNEFQLDNSIQSIYIDSNRSKLSNTYFSFSLSDAEIISYLKDFDIINLHWVEKFISLKNLLQIVNLNKPIIWTLHDMKPFTGGCHYSSNCEGYVDNCSYCPQLLSDSKKLTSLVLNLKKKIFNKAPLTIVSPSFWLANEAKKSTLFKNFPINVIPNSVDITIFNTIKKDVAKKLMNINSEYFVICFGAMSIKEKRKGFQELIQALNILINNYHLKKQIIGIAFGKSNENILPIETVYFSYIDDPQILKTIYNASDVFVLPSLEDNLPNTILEAFSCETPVIGFDTGGIKDLVNNDTGILVNKGDVSFMAEAIYKLINNDEERIQKGKNAKEIILKKYQLKNQAHNYKKLFTDLYNTPIKKRKYSNIDINQKFDKFLGYIFRNVNLPSYNNQLFNDKYNLLIKQINELFKKDQIYVVYGMGNIGKLINNIFNDNKVIYFIDKSSNNFSEKHVNRGIYNPENLINIKFDKIIISVLGREDEIIKYLVEDLKIARDKIITLDL